MKSYDAIDELAALFLTESDSRPIKDEQARSSLVELLLVGHLPVRAGVWLAPYADAVARLRGSSGLVRLDRAEPTIQLMRSAPQRAGRHGSTFTDVLRETAPEVVTWVVRPAHDVAAGELIEVGAGRMTILSSGDGAAVVAAYQLIKSLSLAAEERGESLPPIGIAVVGAEKEAAERMVDRVNQAAASFLDTEVSLVGCLPRIDSDVRCTLDLHFAGEPCPSTRDVIKLIQAAFSTVPQSFSAAERPHNRFASPVEDRPPFVPLVETRRIKLAPKPSRSAAQHVQQEAAAVGPDQIEAKPAPLASYVAGLNGLPIRCPVANAVELAVDGAGGLHLLARETYLRDLRIAESWARTNRELLALASREHELTQTGELTLHVFTDRPQTVADLHGTGLRLHMLTQVKVCEHETWFAAPLN